MMNRPPQRLEKTWPSLSVFLVFIMGASILIWPRRIQPLSIAFLVLGVVVAFIFAIRPDWRKYRNGKLPRYQFVKVITVKVVGLLLVLGVAILVGGWFGRLASQSAWDAGWPEWAVIVTGILTGFAAGFAAGLLVRFTWGKLFEPKHTRKAQTGEE